MPPRPKTKIEKHGFRCFWPFYEGYEVQDPSRTNQGEKSVLIL